MTYLKYENVKKKNLNVKIILYKSTQNKIHSNISTVVSEHQNKLLSIKFKGIAFFQSFKYLKGFRYNFKMQLWKWILYN